MLARTRYTGPLPDAAETVTLFDTTAMSQGNAMPHGGNYWGTWALACDQAGDIIAEWSTDGGDTWHVFDTQTLTPSTPGTAEAFAGQFSVEALRDVRVTFANGGDAQGVFDVNLAFSTER